MYFFAKGAPKLGHIKLWARLWWKLNSARIFLESSGVNFYLHPKPNCPEVTVQKQFSVEKKTIVMLEREKHNTKSQLKREKSKMLFDLVLSR